MVTAPHFFHCSGHGFDRSRRTGLFTGLTHEDFPSRPRESSRSFLILLPSVPSGRLKSLDLLAALRLCKWPECVRGGCRYDASGHPLSAKIRGPGLSFTHLVVFSLKHPQTSASSQRSLSNILLFYLLHKQYFAGLKTIIIRL